jgi:hypothetical protein
VFTYRQLGVNGQMGNQLWEIASTIGEARRHGDVAGFPDWRYRPYFNVPDDLFPDLSDPARRETHDLGWDYLQDRRYLEGVEDEVREYFRPRPEVWTRLATRFAELLALEHKTSLHVRRGDYLVHPGIFISLTPDYYHEAMSQTEGPYLVFSDDLEWCRQHLRGDCIFMEHNRNFEDLFLLSACDEHIIANSTFSWWGAWLSGRPTVCPSQWWVPSYPLSPAPLLEPSWTFVDVGNEDLSGATTGG